MYRPRLYAQLSREAYLLRLVQADNLSMSIRWINRKRLAYSAAAIVFLSLFGGTLFWGGWVLSGWGQARLPVVTTEGGAGYLTLISPAESELLAINGITGDKIDFLPASDMNMLDPEERFLFTSHESRTYAGVTRIDLETGETDILISYLDHAFVNLDGLLWTPWDTLLVGEETTGGRLFEILNPLAPVNEVRYVKRPAFGTRRNEGLAIDSRGFIYGVDEVPGGGIYRFRPDSPLTAESLESGTIEVLVADGSVGKLEDGAVDARWVNSAEAEATGFGRPEDIEIVGDQLFIALTTTHEVIVIDTSEPESASVNLFASAGTNAPDLSNPDNLASDPDGNIYIAENITLSRYKGKSNRIWLAKAGEHLQPATSVELVATHESPRNEFSGILVDSSGERLFTNVLGPDNYILVIQIVDGA